MRKDTVEIRPFTDQEYALLVLQGLKRMVQRGDWYQGYVIARDITASDNAEIGDVVAAISLAQDIIRETIKSA